MLHLHAGSSAATCSLPANLLKIKTLQYISVKILFQASAADQMFNYNNPYGACPKCEGYGKMLGIDPEKVIPDETLSVYQEAVSCWRGEKGKLWLNLGKPSFKI